MIKFFRRIRQQLLTENKFSKYLIYAIGEIVLVVIGILIALQINNWYEHEKQLKLEKEILEEIKLGLESDLENITYVINKHHIFIKCQEKLIDWIENEKAYNEALVPCFKHTTWISWFLPKDAQFESLRQFGIRNISNKELSQQLTKLYDVVYEELQLWQEEARKKTLDFREKQSEMDLEFTKNSSQVSFEIQPSNPVVLQSNRAFLFTLRSVYETMKIYTNIRLIDAKLELEKAIRLIEQELNQR